MCGNKVIIGYLIECLTMEKKEKNRFEIPTQNNYIKIVMCLCRGVLNFFFLSDLIHVCRVRFFFFYFALLLWYSIWMLIWLNFYVDVNIKCVHLLLSHLILSIYIVHSLQSLDWINDFCAFLSFCMHFCAQKKWTFFFDWKIELKWCEEEI